MIRKMIGGVAGSGLALGFASTAFAQAAMIKAPTAAQQLTMINKGDTAWLLVSSLLNRFSILGVFIVAPLPM